MPAPVRAGLLWLLAAAAFAGCGGSAATPATHTSTGTRTTLAAPVVLTPARPAPDFALRSAGTGRLVRLSHLRGRAVLLTFLYANCPDVCPLIAAKLRAALTTLGPSAARKAAIVAVSVDPKGDTPHRVAQFVAEHGLTGQMQYLVGTEAQLAPVWKAYGVAVLPPAAHSTVVGHSSVLYGITASGKRLALYPADTFEPAWIAHDVPLLSAQ